MMHDVALVLLAYLGDRAIVPRLRALVCDARASDEFKLKLISVIHDLEPSDRGELEITDVNNWFIRDGSMTFEVLDGWWTDAGTFESLHGASKLVAEAGANKLD